MYPGRFWLGLGAGEALNEHVVGGEWPEIGVRSSMLFEAIEIINKLFSGAVVRHRGDHFMLESARLYTRPEEPVKVYVATAGPVNAKRTGRLADGMITVGAADEKIGMLWDRFDEGAREAGKDPTGMPKLLQIHISWAPTDERGRRQRDARMAQRRDAVPQAGHQEPGGLRGDGQARPTRGLHQPLPDELRPRVARAARSSTTSTWASTRSTSTTSAGTRPSSSTSSGARSCPRSASAEHDVRPVRRRHGFRILIERDAVRVWESGVRGR